MFEELNSFLVGNGVLLVSVKYIFNTKVEIICKEQFYFINY